MRFFKIKFVKVIDRLRNLLALITYADQSWAYTEPLERKTMQDHHAYNVEITGPVLASRLREMKRRFNPMSTHSEMCWKWHFDCALEIAASRLELDDE